MKPRELRKLVRLAPPALPSTARRLASAYTIGELRELARRRAPRVAFDYADGGADGEVSMARALATYADVEFQPAVLRDVREVDTGRTTLGVRRALPFGIAPTGFTRLMHTDGEIAGVQAARAAGIPFCLSTLGTTSIEAVAAAGAGGSQWFQLYMWRDRERSMELVARAARAGYEALVVTVDVPVAGARLRDARNGMTIPPRITPGAVLDVVRRPRWWAEFVTGDPLEFALFESFDGTVGELLDSMFDPTVDWADLAWLREQWPGKLAVKGVQSVDDARRAADAGVDAVWLSNHGGRQLDRAPVPLLLLPDVRRALGDRVELHVDSGIRSGQDVLTALALGADFAWLGRAYLYGLMAGGRPGVDRALAIITEQLRRTMRLLGVTTLDELGPQHVTRWHVPHWRDRSGPFR